MGDATGVPNALLGKGDGPRSACERDRTDRCEKNSSKYRTARDEVLHTSPLSAIL